MNQPPRGRGRARSRQPAAPTSGGLREARLDVGIRGMRLREYEDEEGEIELQEQRGFNVGGDINRQRPGSAAEQRQVLDPYYYDHSSNAEKERVIRIKGRLIQTAVNKGLGFGFVTGDTGVGKSTIALMGILIHNLPELEANLKIFVGEPRRIAGKDLHTRLIDIGPAHGLNANLFGLKYKDKDVNYRKCKLAFGTSGWLETWLENNPEDIYNFRAIVVDEVHELGTDTEKLLALITLLQASHVRKYGVPHYAGNDKPKGPRFPDVILISATLDCKKFFDHFRPASFFASSLNPMRPGQDEITYKYSIDPLQRKHVDSYNLNNLRRKIQVYVDAALSDFEPDKTGRTKPVGLYIDVAKCMFETLHRIYSEPGFDKFRGGCVLICAPGVKEIEQIVNLKHGFRFELKLCLLEYHSKLSKATLEYVRWRLLNPFPKTIHVIIGTSITDSSLTLPFCKIVMDSCLIKQPNYNSAANVDILTKFWTTDVTRIQRKGRTGRQCEGVYIAFVPAKNVEQKIPPEIERTKLDETFMRAMNLHTKPMFKDAVGFMTEYFTKTIVSNVPTSHVRDAIRSLLDSGVITRQQSHRNQHPFDGFVFTHLGSISSGIKGLPQLTRSMIMASNLGCYESAAILASEAKDLKGELFKRGTSNLRVYWLKEKFANDSPSDDIAVIHASRAWNKADGTTRIDKKPKKYRCDSLIVGYDSKAEKEVLINDSFTGCYMRNLDKIDSNLTELAEMMIQKGVLLQSAVAFKDSDTDYERRQAWIATKHFETFSIMASVPNQLLFKSTPMHPHNIDILRNYNVLNSVFLEPPPPPDADIRDWGPQIQQILAGPRNILPDLVVDRKNGFVVATFPPTPNKPHLGMISKSVKEALHRQKFQGYPWELKIHYRELDSNDVKPIIIPTDLLTQDPMLSKQRREYPVILEAGKGVKIADFHHPHMIGVRPNTPEEWVQEMEDLRKARRHFVPLLLENVKYGKVVIYTDPSQADETTEWEQKCWRAVIGASITAEDLNGLPKIVKDGKKVLVNMIDQGSTYYTHIKNLSDYDAKDPEKNYGLPQLFTRFPKLGYRLIMSTVQPYIQDEWAWNGGDLGIMHYDLRSQESFGAVVNIKLPLVDSSELDRVIVAEDIYGVNNRKSFKDYLFGLHVGKTIGKNDRNQSKKPFATPLRNVRFLNADVPEPSQTCLPRPQNFDILCHHQKRVAALNNIVKDAEKKKEFFPYHVFTKIWSPLQVAFISVDDFNTDFTMEPTVASINCCFPDHRLASTAVNPNNYDPLYGIPSEYHVVESKNGKIVLADGSTISNPIPGIVSLYLMLKFPFVELLTWNKKPVAIRLYAIGISGKIELKATHFLKVQLIPADRDDIQFIRKRFNAQHMAHDSNPDAKLLTSTLLRLLHAKREPLRLDELPELPDTLDQEMRRGFYIIPKLHITPIT